MVPLTSLFPLLQLFFLSGDVHCGLTVAFERLSFVERMNEVLETARQIMISASLIFKSFLSVATTL